jgi:archaellum component FlaF (FlaF/FlaG flagellin family)
VDKVITTMMLIIASIVALGFVVNAILPTIQRTSNDIAVAGDVVGARLRSDVRIVEASGVVDTDSVNVWAKNVGASTVSSLEKIDVFFGPTDDFERITYDSEPTCPNPDPPPRTQPCWQYVLENDTEWGPSATLGITIYLTADLAAATDYVVTIVLPNGITASKVFTL